MTQQNDLPNQPAQAVSFIKLMVAGAAFALIIISVFVFGVDHPNPEWGKFWFIRPLIITPLAGAMGGAFLAFMIYLGERGFNKTIAILLGIMVYFIGLWLGSVLGLAGTLWN